MEQIRESYLNHKETYPGICVCCGAPVPEGRMICWKCEHEDEEDEIKGFRLGGTMEK